MLKKPLMIVLGCSVIVVAIAYFASYAYVVDKTPKTVMAQIEGRIAKVAGGFNACRHNRNYGPRFGTVARANPDSIVTSMSYDVSTGPVELSGFTWPDYWSLSVYQHNTDNIFVVNDRQLPSDTFHVIITPTGRKLNAPEGAIIVESPTATGIVLVRRFVVRQEDMPDALLNQDAMTCGMFTPSPDKA